MALTALSAFLALLSPLLALPSAFIATLLLRFIIACARLATELPFATLSVPIPPVLLVIFFYSLAGLALYWRYHVRHSA